MIIHLPNTTANEVNNRLVRLRDEGGAVALGRVLTLVITAADESVERAIAAANDASREHPCRVIVVAPPQGAGLNAQIRVGGDAGASEVVILRAEHTFVDTLIMPLLLPDAPIVAWWPCDAPADPLADPIRQMASRRITDSTVSRDPEGLLQTLAGMYQPGDTDLAWARITLWRALIASALEQPPYDPVLSVAVEGESGHTSLNLLAAWLGQRLRCPARVVRVDGAQAITKVVLTRRSGEIVLDRPDGREVTIRQPGTPDRRMALPIRTLSEVLIEELRRLDPDEVYGEVLTKALDAVQLPAATS